MSSLEDLVSEPDFILLLIQSILEQAPDIFLDEDDLFPLQEINGQVAKRRKRKKDRFEIDFKETNWGKFISDPEVKDPWSVQGKLFRRRFRVPFTVYAWICTQCKILNVFEIKRERSVEIPIEIKVLICLRMLGRGDCADAVSEISEVSESHCRNIFLLFITNFRNKLEKDIIYAPQGDELRSIMDDYASLGLPGTVGSVDVTHVYMDKCPSNLSNLCTGKEKKTTLAFEVVVTHRKKIISVSQGEYGSLNDKTICKMDRFVADIMYARIYQDVESTIYNSNGEKIRIHGAHLICDGGYHKIPAMICPLTFRMEMKEVFWSEWVESVRKDVECTFGILKQRFRILKNSYQGHSLDYLENVFVVCCMIHNILLIVDGGENTWEAGIEDECLDESSESIENIEMASSNVVDDLNTDDITMEDDNNLLLSSSDKYDAWLQFHSKTAVMIDHFAKCYSLGELHWMRTMPDGSKQFFPVGNRKTACSEVITRILTRENIDK